MTEQEKIEQAKSTFQTICKTLDNTNLKYDKNEENLILEYDIQGDDLPMNFKIAVDSDRQLVLLYSHFPFVIHEDKRLDVAVAVSAVNNLLVDGCFDFDIASGHLFFRATNTFIGNKFADDVIIYMLLISRGAVDEYNDKFLMIDKGMLSIDKFLSLLPQ